MNKRPIANEITGDDDDAYCSVCEDDTLVVRIKGNVSADSFGGAPEIYLCQHCLARMMAEIKELNL